MADGLSMMNVILMGSVFVLILSLWCAAVSLWSLRRGAREHKIKQRLGLESQEPRGERMLRLWHDGASATTAAPGRNVRLSLRQKLQRLHRDAGFDAPLAVMLPACVMGAALAGLALFAIAKSAVLGVVTAFAALFLILSYVKGRAARRKSRFELQLIDALDLASRSLRAGHPLPAAFRLISEEIPVPVGDLFKDIAEQQELGVSLEAALRRAAEQTDHPDFKLFAVSVAIQMRSGGNLADMMGRVAYVIRDRLRLSRRVHVLTAQTQFSKRVLIAVPVLLFVLLNVISPKYMNNLYTTRPGHIVMLMAVAGLVTGSWIMNKMAILRY